MDLQRQFVVHRQFSAADCGPACLRMIAHHYGKHYTHDVLKGLVEPIRNGITLSVLGQAAERIGFQTLAVKIAFEQLDEEMVLPCILYWNRKHYVVIPPQDYSRDNQDARIMVADPSEGMIEMERKTFLESWLDPTDNLGVALLLEPTEKFYELDPKG
jgi:ATP-binding cassette subfamily B protein